MTQNPFESPQANPYVQSAPAVGGTGTFDIGQAVSEAWSATTANPGPAILGVFLSGLVSMVAMLTVVGLFLVVPIVALGTVVLLFNLHEGRGEVGDIFSGFQDYGHNLGKMLMFGFLFFVVAMAMALPGLLIAGAGGALEMPALAILGQLLNIVLQYGVFPRFNFAVFYVVDQDMGAADALRASWEATGQQWLMTVLLNIVAAIVAVVGVFACFIGLFFTAPMSYLIWISAYRQMVGGGAAEPSAPSNPYAPA